jgi:hypothetical protein
LEKGLVEGKLSDFEWLRLERLPSAELRETHSAVVAFNEDRRIKYRILIGPADDPVILVRKVAAVAS